MLVLIPLALSLLILSLSDNYFTLWIYQTFAALFLIALLSVMDGEVTKRNKYIIFAVVGCVGLGGTFFFGWEAVFFAFSLILGIGFIQAGISMLVDMINPKPGTGSVITVMFIFAPIALVVGCYYLAIGYQGLGLDAYLGLAQYIPIF